MVSVSPSLHAAENSGGPCIDNMCFQYVKGRSPDAALQLSNFRCRAVVQREMSVGVAMRTHADCHEAAVKHGERRWLEWRLCEAQRS